MINKVIEKKMDDRAKRQTRKRRRSREFNRGGINKNNKIEDTFFEIFSYFFLRKIKILNK